MRRARCAAFVLLIAAAGMAFGQTQGVGAGAPPFERVAGALALIDLRAVAQYDFSADAWPKLGVTPWPIVSLGLPPSDLTGLLTDMEAALNRLDVGAALKKAPSLAFAARDAGLGVTAVGIAEVAAAYAERQADQGTREQMARLIRTLQARLGATPEYSAQGVPEWILALKPKTLFVGTDEAVKALGISGVQSRFANMVDILSQDMAARRDLRVCKSHPEAPDHLIRDYWVLIQRFRVDTGKLSSLLAAGDFGAVQRQVGYFNGSWGLAREVARGLGCSTRGAGVTWK